MSVLNILRVPDPQPTSTVEYHCCYSCCSICCWLLAQFASRSILGVRSGMRKGLAIESSYASHSLAHTSKPAPNLTLTVQEVVLTIPASNAICTCSALALADTATIGKHLVTISPVFCNSRIRLAALRPSRTGISMSMRMTSTSLRSAAPSREAR